MLPKLHVHIHLFLLLVNRLADTIHLLIISVSKASHDPSVNSLSYHGFFPWTPELCTHPSRLPTFPTASKEMLNQ